MIKLHHYKAIEVVDITKNPAPCHSYMTIHTSSLEQAALVINKERRVYIPLMTVVSAGVAHTPFANTGNTTK
jgi:hypothetical protein